MGIGGVRPTPFINTLGGADFTSTNLQIGWQFSPQSDLYIIGAQLFTGNSGTTETVSLWQGSTLVDTVSIVSAGSSWTPGYFASPILLSSTLNYTLSMYAGGSTRGTYDRAVSGFTFNGVNFSRGRTGSGSGFPTTTSTTTIYGFVDGLYLPV